MLDAPRTDWTEIAFLPSEVRDPTTGGDAPPASSVREVVDAVVDPHWVERRLALLIAVRGESADPGPCDLDGTCVAALLTEGLEVHARDARLEGWLRALTDDPATLLDAHSGAWSRTDCAPEWRAAVRRCRGRHQRTTLRRVLEQRLSELRGLLPRTREAVARILRDTYVFPAPRVAVYGKARAEVLSPAGLVRAPVRCEWRSVSGARDDVSVLRERRGAPPLSVFERRRAASPMTIERGSDGPLEPGSYEFRLVRHLAGETVRAATQFEVLEKESDHRLDVVRDRLGDLAGEGPGFWRLWGAVLEAELLHLEAIEAYAWAYRSEADPCVAARIARCYRGIGLEASATDWTERAAVDSHAESAP